MDERTRSLLPKLNFHGVSELRIWFAGFKFTYTILFINENSVTNNVVHSRAKVYRIFFCKLKNSTAREFFVFLESRIKPDCFSLNIWNITYLGHTATVQYSKTISNPSNFRCRLRSWVAKTWKWTISTVYFISNKASIFVIRDMKYQTP